MSQAALDEAASRVATALRHDVEAHRRGSYADIGTAYDHVLNEVLPLWNHSGGVIATAFTFWDWWIDARNHNWLYYPGIARDDWPRLAVHMAEVLDSQGTITDPQLLAKFARAARPSLLQRLRRFWRRGTASA